MAIRPGLLETKIGEEKLSLDANRVHMAILELLQATGGEIKTGIAPTNSSCRALQKHLDGLKDKP